MILSLSLFSPLVDVLRILNFGHVLHPIFRVSSLPLTFLELFVVFLLRGRRHLVAIVVVSTRGLKIRQWKHWQDSIAEDKYEAQKVLVPKITQVHQHAFIKGYFLGLCKDSSLMGWLHSFSSNFWLLTKLDYVTLRHGFIQTHCKSNLKFNFYKYMIRALEDDFKQVVGISWYLWIFVVIFLLLNVNG
ncbi:hypothetical protein K1719_022971 [Acacia pycnantha]|nr:hypothetical protein K1719_022971 [Acacia pycnantha]